MKPLEPRPEGIKQADDPVNDKGFLRKYELPLGRATRLGELADEYAFFTPAALYVHGQFSDNPLLDFMWERGQAVEFFYRRFRQPIFLGLDALSNGDPAWNFVLMAVRREHFDALARFIVSMAMADPSRRRYIGFGQQTLLVPDPLALDRAVVWSGELPTLHIEAFGVNASDYRAAFVSDGVGPPMLRRFPPTNKMRHIAAKCFQKKDVNLDPLLGR